MSTELAKEKPTRSDDISAQSTGTQEVDWRQVLSHSLPASMSAIAAQRAWAQLCRDLRDLCPETDWHFLNDENYTPNETEVLQSFSSFFKSMIASEAWPFPEKVLVIAEGKDHFRSWKVSILKTEGKFPQMNPAPSVTVSQWSDESCHGIKIRSLPSSFISTKSGEA